MNFNAPIIPSCLIYDVTGMLGHFCIFAVFADFMENPLTDYPSWVTIFLYEYSLCVSTFWQSLPSIHIIYLAGIKIRLVFQKILFNVIDSIPAFDRRKAYEAKDSTGR